MSTEPIRDCNNNPINFVDPTGHKPSILGSITSDPQEWDTSYNVSPIQVDVTHPTVEIPGVDLQPGTSSAGDNESGEVSAPQPSTNTGPGDIIYNSAPYQWFEHQNPYVQTAVAVPGAFAVASAHAVVASGATLAEISTVAQTTFTAAKAQSYVYAYTGTKALEHVGEIVGSIVSKGAAPPPTTKTGFYFEVAKEAGKTALEHYSKH